MKKLVMYRVLSGLHILGKKSFFGSLFGKVRLKDCYFTDFEYKQNGVIDKIYLNTMKLFSSHDKITINKKHILFEYEPDSELVEIYNSMTENVKKSKSTETLL